MFRCSESCDSGNGDDLSSSCESSIVLNNTIETQVQYMLVYVIQSILNLLKTRGHRSCAISQSKWWREASRVS